MAKLVFLVALIIALVSVSSAAWTITTPVDADKITPGAPISFTFTTGADIAVDDSLTVFTLGTKTFFTPLVVAGEGVVQSVCTVNGIPVGTSTVGDTSAMISFNTQIAALSILTCVFRVNLDAKDTYTVTLTAPNLGMAVSAAVETNLTVVAAPCTVKIPVNDANDNGTTSVSIEFSALTANTLYGPFTVGYLFDDKSELQSDTYTAGWMQTSDFNSNIDTNARLSIVGGKLWLLIGATAPASATAQVEYGTWSTIDVNRGKNYSVWVQNDAATPVTAVVRVVPAFHRQTVTASIGYTAGKIYYSITISRNADVDPTCKFSIGKYSANIVFGADASLAYTVGTAASTPLDFSKQAFEYQLTAAVGTSITVSGSFPASTFELATFSGSIDGQSANSEITVSGYISKVALGAVTDNVLTYTMTVASSAISYTGSVNYKLSHYIRYVSFDFGDVRAIDAYAPQCKSDGSVSVDGQVTKDNLDLNLQALMASGTLATGSSTHTITCTQKLQAGSKGKSLTINIHDQSLNVIANDKQDLFTPVATKLFNQKITIYGPSITDAASMKTVIDAATALIIPEFAGATDAVAADFVYQYVASTVQHYSANFAGLAIDFTNPMVAHYSKAGSLITLAFNRKVNGKDSPAPVNKSLYTQDMTVMLEGVAAGADVTAQYQGIDAVAAFVDGSASPGYELNTSIGNGYGFKCATSAQCAAEAVCLSGMCSEMGQLSRVQQMAMSQGSQGGDSSSASAVFTSLALVIAVVALLF